MELTDKEFFDEIKRICKIKRRKFDDFIYKPMRELAGKTPYELSALGSQAKYIGLVTLYRRYKIMSPWGQYYH